MSEHPWRDVSPSWWSTLPFPWKDDNPRTIASDEWDSAIKNGCVSFHQLTDAYFGLYRLSEGELSDSQKKQRKGYFYYYRKLLQSFQRTHGTIMQGIYLNDSGVILTSRGEVHIRYPANTELHDIRQLLQRCGQLYIEVSRLLTGQDRRICAEMIYGIVSELLRLANAPRHEGEAPALATDGANKRDFSFLEREINDATDYYYRCANRSAQLLYFQGMFYGIFALLLAVIIVDLMHDPIHSNLHMPDEHLVPLVLSLIAGGLGAAVSAMQRMATGDLTPDYEVGPDMLKLLGMFRAIMGAIFGIVACSILRAGLAPLEMRTGASEFHFYYAVAFIAGFSERWVKDMLLVIERGGDRKGNAKAT